MGSLEYWVPCPRGLEAILGEELRSMGIRQVRPLRSGVAFHGSLGQGYRACLWSRIASRVLLVLARVDAPDAETLYSSVHDLPWEDHIPVTGTIAISAGGVNDNLRNTQFTAVKVKDAICDRLRERSGERPSVDTEHPDVRVNIAVRDNRATLSIDLSGETLHRRGYRPSERSGGPSLREDLAAGLLLVAGWPEKARMGGALVNPFCGSGTVLVEGAWIAGDVAPGILRSTWGFENWLGHETSTWDGLLAEADDRAEQGRPNIPPIFGSDGDASQIASAREVLRRARVDDLVTLQNSDITGFTAPQSTSGLVALNPPYGGHAVARSQLAALYSQLAGRLRRTFEGYELAVLSPDQEANIGLGMQPRRTMTVAGGAMDVILSVYTIGTADNGTAGADEAVAEVDAEKTVQDDTAALNAGTCITVAGRQLAVAEPNTQQFADRLHKMYVQRRKWARKNGVSCYRIYDADLPDYAVAIDLYQGAAADLGHTWVHVSEYAAPADIDPVKAHRRLSDALAVTSEVLDVPAEEVFLKVRKRERGGSQYAGRLSKGRSTIGVVQEDYLLFQVNLSDYLDTGLFLDHRITRELVFEKAERTRFLNLFAYTGSATVHAAAGGAFQTTTVDMSQTYLDWARRNMALNGFTGEEHEYLRADCLEWVREMRHDRYRWDLIFVDPPTFSSGAKMGVRTWDVQRDHAEFLIDVSRLLTRDGIAIFSCNLRNFCPDLETLERAGIQMEDITASTIPEDFSRNPKIHHCYLMRRVS